MVGRPHNVVRHPDVPKAAFQDLWTTVQAGRPWTGIVKNRCKNDDYYWVLANISPLVEDGKIVGYISVCSKPTATDVRAAERVYESIARGERRWVLKEGRVRRNSAWHSLLQRLPQTLRARRHRDHRPRRDHLGRRRCRPARHPAGPRRPGVSIRAKHHSHQAVKNHG